MVSKMLGRLVQKAVSVGLLSGLKIGSNEIPISLIQFVDDSLFILEDNLGDFRNLRCWLLLMKAATRLKIDLQKSKIIVVGQAIHMREIADIMGCEIATLPYL